MFSTELFKTENENYREILDEIIEDSPGLTQDTKFYRGGYIPPNAVAGETYEFEGYTSLSYLEDSAFNQEYKIEVYVKKGQKGVVMERELTEHPGEHEYLLPRNQKYTIIEVDHNPQNPTAKILVY